MKAINLSKVYANLLLFVAATNRQVELLEIFQITSYNSFAFRRGECFATPAALNDTREIIWWHEAHPNSLNDHLTNGRIEGVQAGLIIFTTTPYVKFQKITKTLEVCYVSIWVYFV